MKTITYHGEPGWADSTDEDGAPVAADVFRSFDHHRAQAFTVAAGDTVDVSDQAAADHVRDFPDLFTIDGDAGPDPDVAPAPGKKSDKADKKVAALTEQLAAAQATVAELEAKVAELQAELDQAGGKGSSETEPVTIEELLKQTRSSLDALAVQAGVENAADLEVYPTKRDLAAALLAKASE